MRRRWTQGIRSLRSRVQLRPQPQPNQASTPHALVAKLRSTQGTFLAEHLMSIIFIGLLCVAIAAGLSAALSSYAGITAESNAQQLLKQSMQEIGNELTFSLEVGEGGNYVSPTTRTMVSLGNDPDGKGIVLVDKTTPSTSPTPAEAPTLLVPAANGMTPSVSVPVFSTTKNTWSYTITIKRGSEVFASQEMTVARTMAQEVQP